MVVLRLTRLGGRQVAALERALLQNSCPYTTYPTFSSLLTTHHIFPSMNSSPPRTNCRTNPHSSPTPHSLRWNPIPFLDASSAFHFSRHNPFRSSTSPSVHWSPFHISYAFLFGSAASALHSVSPFYIVRFSISFSHWFSDVVAYPEPYLELRFSLHSVLYKVT